MAVPGIPINFNVQQGNGQVFLSWDLTAGALSYSVQRSLDGVTYSAYNSPVTNSYLDTAVTIGTLYYYQVAGVNASGTGQYAVPQSSVPTPTSEMSLGEIRLKAQQRADRINSNFVTMPEWNSYINQSMYALYDILITTYEDYFMAPRAQFSSSGGQSIYPLPNGVLSFLNTSGASFVPAPFYKLLGVDLSLNSSANGFVTMDKYNLIDRNAYLYGNTASVAYGSFNLRYRVIGTNIELTPTPSSGQLIQLLYIPRLPQMLRDNDITTIGFSGWLEYVIVRAAILALTKEESDVSSLVMQLQDIQKRIEESAVNRDAGQPDTISDTRSTGGWNDGFGSQGSW